MDEYRSGQKILRLKDVCERVGLRKSTLYQWISQDLFPKPVNLGERSVGWVEAEIDEWIRDRILERV